MFKVIMTLERSTKGALRYREVTKDGIPLLNIKDSRIGTLYVRKTAFGASVGVLAPHNIEVTVKEIEGEG